MSSPHTPVRTFVKDITPPLLLRAYWRLRGNNLRFDGDFATWTQARSNSSGYDSDEIFEKTRAAALKVKNGEAVYDRDSAVFDHVEYSFPMLAALLREARAKQGRLRVLDFGGSLGTGYRQFKAFCEGGESVSWNIVDQSRIVECGRELFRNDELDFFPTIREAVKGGNPDVIIVSSVLQYLEKPYVLIGDLTSLGASSIVIDRTPVGTFDRDILAVQTVPATIYNASYPCWIFSRSRLIKAFPNDYPVLAEIRDSSAAWRCAGGDFRFDGFILAKQEG